MNIIYSLYLSVSPNSSNLSSIPAIRSMPCVRFSYLHQSYKHITACTVYGSRHVLWSSIKHHAVLKADFEATVETCTVSKSRTIESIGYETNPYTLHHCKISKAFPWHLTKEADKYSSISETSNDDDPSPDPPVSSAIIAYLSKLILLPRPVLEGAEAVDCCAATPCLPAYSSYNI